jgi:hypothetical protein
MNGLIKTQWLDLNLNEIMTEITGGFLIWG